MRHPQAHRDWDMFVDFFREKPVAKARELPKDITLSRASTAVGESWERGIHRDFSYSFNPAKKKFSWAGDRAEENIYGDGAAESGLRHGHGQWQAPCRLFCPQDRPVSGC